MKSNHLRCEQFLTSLNICAAKETFPQSPGLVGDSFYFKVTPRWRDIFHDVNQIGPCSLIPLFDIVGITDYEFAQLLPLPLPVLCCIVYPQLVSVFVAQEVIG